MPSPLPPKRGFSDQNEVRPHQSLGPVLLHRPLRHQEGRIPHYGLRRLRRDQVGRQQRTHRKESVRIGQQKQRYLRGIHGLARKRSFGLAGVELFIALRNEHVLSKPLFGPRNGGHNPAVPSIDSGAQRSRIKHEQNADESAQEERTGEMDLWNQSLFAAR